MVIIIPTRRYFLLIHLGIYDRTKARISIKEVDDRWQTLIYSIAYLPLLDHLALRATYYP